MRVKKLFCVLFSVLMMTSVFAGIDFSAYADSIKHINLPVTYHQTEARQLLGMVNSFRTGSDAHYKNEDGTVYTCKNLSKYVYDYDLEKIAMQRAAELALYYSHYRPDGTACFTAYDNYPVSASRVAKGENIARGNGAPAADPSVIFNAWREDGNDHAGQSHRRTMLSADYTAIGCACAYVDGVYYWVQEFRSPTVNTTKTTANNKLTDVTIDILSSNYDLVPASTKALVCDNHVLKTASITPATTTDNGSITRKCSSCGKSTKTAINKIDKATLSKTSYVYDGNYKKPAVTVKSSSGKVIDPKYYTVTYSNNKSVGKATVKIVFKDRYSGTIKKTFKINPKATTISSLTATKGGFKVTWKKKTTQTTGYQVQYATDSKFTKNKKTLTISKNTTTSKSVSKLTKGKKYYVRVRTYKTVNGTKYYSSWSSYKTVTTKK